MPFDLVSKPRHGHEDGQRKRPDPFISALDEHMGEIYQESLDAIAKYIVTNAHLFCYP